MACVVCWWRCSWCCGCCIQSWQQHPPRAHAPIAAFQPAPSAAFTRCCLAARTICCICQLRPRCCLISPPVPAHCLAPEHSRARTCASCACRWCGACWWQSRTGCWPQAALCGRSQRACSAGARRRPRNGRAGAETCGVPQSRRRTTTGCGKRGGACPAHAHVCSCMHTYTCMRGCMCTYVHILTHECTRMHTTVCTHEHTHNYKNSQTCTQLCALTNMHIPSIMHTSMSACMHACSCTCMLTRTHEHLHTWTHACTCALHPCFWAAARALAGGHKAAGL